jgi:hypothetical protein
MHSPHLAAGGRGNPVFLVSPAWSRESIMLNWEQERKEWVVVQMVQISAVLTEIGQTFLNKYFFIYSSTNVLHPSLFPKTFIFLVLVIFTSYGCFIEQNVYKKLITVPFQKSSLTY